MKLLYLFLLAASISSITFCSQPPAPAAPQPSSRRVAFQALQQAFANFQASFNVDDPKLPKDLVGTKNIFFGAFLTSLERNMEHASLSLDKYDAECAIRGYRSPRSRENSTNVLTSSRQTPDSEYRK